MLRTYKRKATIAAVIWFVALLALLSMEPEANIWQEVNLPAQALLIALGASWFYALWAYLMSCLTREVQTLVASRE